MIDLTQFVGKTVAAIKLSRSGASLLIVFTDGSEIEVNAQENKGQYPTLHIY